jgi:cytoskeletal protein CcmA (bactofilin family)
MAFWTKPQRDEPGDQPSRQDGDGPAAPQPASETREEPNLMAMLKREDLPTSAAAPMSDLNALLGRGSEFEGKLTFEGTVRIDGKFTGSIITNDVLVVGEGAKISAEITCGTIIVHGEVNGNVRAKTAVELHHPARMRGNIESPSLMIEKGVLFEGQAKMENLSSDRSDRRKLDEPKPSAPPPVQAVKS